MSATSVAHGVAGSRAGGQIVRNRLHIDIHSEPGGLDALVDRLAGPGDKFRAAAPQRYGEQ